MDMMIPRNRFCPSAVQLTILGCLAIFLLCLSCSSRPVVSDLKERNNPFSRHIGTGTVSKFTQQDEVISGKMRAEHGYTIRYTEWRPEKGNGKVIIYVHGFQSHRGWFYSTANVFAENGYVMYAFDRIGSGESSNGLSIWGDDVIALRGHIRSWSLFLETLEQMIAVAVRDNPGNEIILWANSYGAKIATAYLFDRVDQVKNRRITAAIFTTPGLYSNHSSMPLPFSKIKLLFSSNTSLFPVPMVSRNKDNGASWFVAPGPWFEIIQADELSLREVTRSFYLETRNMDRFISRQQDVWKLDLPIFYLMVKNDIMMDNDLMEQHIRSHTTKSVFKYYQGGPENKHFILFTEDRNEAIDDILLFLEGRENEIQRAHYIRSVP